MLSRRERQTISKERLYRRATTPNELCAGVWKRCFLSPVGVLLSSCNWFRLRPKGGAPPNRRKAYLSGTPGLSGLEVPNSANVPVGGRPTFILGLVYVASLQTAETALCWQIFVSSCRGATRQRGSSCLSEFDVAPLRPAGWLLGGSTRK